MEQMRAQGSRLHMCVCVCVCVCVRQPSMQAGEENWEIESPSLGKMRQRGQGYTRHT